MPAEPNARWLLLIHHIPPKPDYLRVKVRRQLQRVGAVALKNSVYVLPHTDDAMEDFQWLRRMVVSEGGEATLCEAGFIEGVSDQEVEAMFRLQADAEYREIAEAARAAAARPTDVGIQRFQRQMVQAAARDHFGSERADEAVQAVRDLKRAFEREPGPTVAPSPTGEAAPRAATWVTRAGVFVDRMASAWLIKRFVDTEARFKFVPAKGYCPEPGELRFDMFEGEYTHEGDLCTCEVLARRFGAANPALQAVAEVVHDIDCKDDRFGREETAGVASLVRGIADGHADDGERLAASAALFDALYAAFQSPGA